MELGGWDKQKKKTEITAGISDDGILTQDEAFGVIISLTVLLWNSLFETGHPKHLIQNGECLKIAEIFEPFILQGY